MTVLFTFVLIGVVYVAAAKSRHDRTVREELDRKRDSVYAATRAGAACSDVGALGEK